MLAMHQLICKDSIFNVSPCLSCCLLSIRNLSTCSSWRAWLFHPPSFQDIVDSTMPDDDPLVCHEGQNRIVGGHEHDLLFLDQELECLLAVNARILDLIDQNDGGLAENSSIRNHQRP